MKLERNLEVNRNNIHRSHRKYTCLRSSRLSQTQTHARIQKAGPGDPDPFEKLQK